MTIKELIKRLEDFPPATIVYSESYSEIFDICVPHEKYDFVKDDGFEGVVLES